MPGLGLLSPARSPRSIARRQHLIHRRIPCPHYESELETITAAILERQGVEGDVAEFGCYKGGSTAKLSLACAHIGKRLLAFDSFEGLPEPEPWDAEHQIERVRVFTRGEYAGSLGEVKTNVARYGEIDVCEFVPGWFSETLEGRSGDTFAVAFVDVDLAQSTRTVLEYAWPRLSPGGIIFVHDATDAMLQDVVADRDLLAGFGERFFPPRTQFADLPTKTLAWITR